MLLKKLLIKPKANKILEIIISLLMILGVIYIFIKGYKIVRRACYNIEDFYLGEIEELRYSYVRIAEIDDIYTINNYISDLKSQNKKYLMMNAVAYYNYILNKESNGYYDMPLIGNTGSKTEEEILEDVKNMHDIYILLSDDLILTYQEFMKVREYVMQNCEKVADVEKLLVYYKK